MFSFITANELKTKGIAAIEHAVQEGNEAIITVRGKQKFIVISMDDYNQLREKELTSAVMEAKSDLENGRFYIESVQEHIHRLISNV